jgi:hypothetical protein
MVYDQLFERFADSRHPAVQDQIAKGLANKGVTLGQLDRPDDEITAYDQLFQRFADSRHPAVQEQIAKRLANKGLRLRQLDRWRLTLSGGWHNVGRVLLLH